MKILYASEEEKINIDDAGNLTISVKGEDGLMQEEEQKDEDESLV